MHHTFDVAAVREQFPALNRAHNGRRVVYFDGPGGSQMTRRSIEAMRVYMEGGGANLHGVFPTSVETEEILARARRAAGAFLGVEPEETSFGANMTTLTFAISRALAREWDEGSEIVVTELDHRANVDPWLHAAADKGAKVRWLPVDPGTLTLDLDDLEERVNERMKLVAVGLASNAVGTVNDVAKIAQRAREIGAIVAVDAVHAAPHLPLDREAIGADIITCSAYKFFGPHVGVAAIRRELFERLNVYRLHPAPDHIPDKLETGTQNHEGIAGVEGAISFLSSLGEGDSMRESLVSAMREIEAYETFLADRLRATLRDLPGITLYAAPESVRKTPTIAFRVDRRNPIEVCERALEHGFFIASGDFYASTLAEKLGIREKGGWIRAGLAPYNTVGEVDGFIEAMAKLVEG